MEDEDYKKPRRERKKKPECKHLNLRAVFGDKKQLLWKECKQCNFDFPLLLRDKK